MSVDAELLARWRTGDRDAGDRLLQRHFKSLYRFFAHKVDGGVEDLIQRTLLRCVERRDDVKKLESFRAYLFSIARHELYARLRQLKRDRDQDDISECSVADLTASLGSVVTRKREQRLLLEALRALPVATQLLLELHYWESMSTQELSAALDIPQGTVKSRLRLAREALRDRLEQLADSPELLASTVSDLDRWASELRAEASSSPSDLSS